MRFAIVSDIHANLQAWMAVSTDISGLKVDHIISLGDLVGYGPNPLEVCMMVKNQVSYHLLGNHDAAACGKMEIHSWNRRARQMVLWTQQCLPDGVMDWFREMPLSLSNGQCRCTHAEFSRPGAFYYLSKPKHALLSWKAIEEQIGFVGHTHRTCLYVLGRSGKPHQLEAQSFVCEPHKRYIVNVGSVGFPRDVQDQASYVIFDDTEQAVYFRRVPFDHAGYLVALESRGFIDAPSQPDMTETSDSVVEGGDAQLTDAD